MLKLTIILSAILHHAPVLNLGRSAKTSKFELGMFLQTATWFDANATCVTEGFDTLLNIYDPKRMFWAVKKFLQRIE